MRNRRRSRGLTFYQKQKKLGRNFVKEVMHFLFITLAAVILAVVLVFCIGLRTGVIGVAMQPTLQSGQQILVNRLVYRILAPKSGDVVVFYPNGNKDAHYYVKRVVAVPGDTLQIKDGFLYVNGYQYSGYDFDKIEEPGLADEPLQMGPDEFFMLGDNVNNSEDSRADNIGPVSRKDIAGKVWLKFKVGDEPMALVK
ncbi:MAG: signal peptidase I [Lachnospiraceae bacterium]|nr:signal peptidase I [Lachnospiraceae bacterium]